ncbi:hypothetical protein ACPXCO_23470 [Streptomyces cyaneofuscatus]|uniref:hypothetical protein n=1 Tax=Streptomyces cyaneofuscatus TaxID=66883 RepID=UPI003CF28861
MPWDWDAYFNSSSTPGPAPRKRVAPLRAPHLRLVQQMDWGPYFDSGTGPSPERQGGSGAARPPAVRGVTGKRSAP